MSVWRADRWARLRRRCGSMRLVLELEDETFTLEDGQSPLATAETYESAAIDFGVAGFLGDAQRCAQRVIPLAAQALEAGDRHSYSTGEGEGGVFAGYVAHRAMAVASWILGMPERRAHLEDACRLLGLYSRTDISSTECLRASVRILTMRLRLMQDAGGAVPVADPAVRELQGQVDLEALVALMGRVQSLLQTGGGGNVRASDELERYLIAHIDPARLDGPYIGELQRVDLALMAEVLVILRGATGSASDVFRYIHDLPPP